MALLAGLLLLSSCAAPPAATPLPPSPVPTLPTPTATIVWFPPTATPTPMPPPSTPQPTADMRPGIGPVVFEDDFSQNTGWQLGTTSDGTVSIGDKRLMMVTAQPRAVLRSLHLQPQWGDFYLEMNVSVSLCTGGDQYGLLFRTTSSTDFYRLVLNCQGQMRLEIARQGESSVLVNWIQSPQVVPGAPLAVRIGIWAQGGDFRFFVNDVYQFSARDTWFSTGGIGAFARASGAGQLSVSFSALSVRALSGGPAPGAVPTAGP